MNTLFQIAGLVHDPSAREAPEQAVLAELAQQTGFALLRDGTNWRIYRNPTQVLVATDPRSLTEVLDRVDRHVQKGGEAAGVLYYELGYALEPRLLPLWEPTSKPLCWFGLYAPAQVCNISFPEEDVDGVLDGNGVDLLLARDDYRGSVETIRDLIEAGEVYQINFTTRVRFTTKRNPWETFRILFRRHPVPYAAFLNTGDEQIVSLSPEMFFKVEDGRITVKPMKGTSARGRFLEEDLLVAEQLRHSGKDRAENVMIVDLMRNDLGRICRTGSVKTSNIFDVERFPSVWQMTSTIQGELSRDFDLASVLSSIFPSGSVTGAPKIRAMEHIARLEPPRGAYTGAIGFLAPERVLFNVAIRTLELQGEQGRMGIGSGITYDSDPVAEWEECQCKARFLTDVPPEFRIIETLRWERDYRLLDAHLARMRDSAVYFGFDFSEERARSELDTLAARFRDQPKRVRITLNREGAFELTHADCLGNQYGRVGISNRPVRSQDRFLFHKTTHRDTYESALRAARKLELDDFLFFNQNGELTEGTIHNVFLVTGEVWRTPSLTCGLLPGTFRAHILGHRQNSGEAVLHLEDLKRADFIYLCNSVRGIFPVKIDWNARWG